MTATPPLSIFYDARTVSPAMGGVGRYALCLLQALAARASAQPGAAVPHGARAGKRAELSIRALFRAECVALARRDPKLAGVEIIESPVSHESHPRGDLWLDWRLPRQIAPDEIYHGPAFIIPGGARPFARVVTIHDLFVFTHPKFYPAAFRAWLRWRIRRGCRFAERIIVPSQAIADEVAARKLAAAKKIRVIAEAPDATVAPWEEPLREMPPWLAAHYGAKPLLLTVGTLDPRKDPLTAREALVRLSRWVAADRRCGSGRSDRSVESDRSDKSDGSDESDKSEGGINERAGSGRGTIPWLWIGGPGALPDPTPAALARAAAAAGFCAIGPAPGPAVRAALKVATALVTCSHAEGFGLPLAEALAAGCPIVASDIPVHREVAGDAALYFPPGDPAALADALEKIISDPPLHARLAGAASRRAAQFSWGRAAAATCEVYREALRESQHGGRAGEHRAG